MTQPTRSSRWATDATYTSGVDNGLANKVVPSSGARAQGFRRDKRLPVARLNSLLADHGEYLESLVDSAAVNWTLPFFTAGDEPAFDGMGNGLYAGPIVAPGHWYSNIEREALVVFNVDGLWYSTDGRAWTNGAGAVGFSANAASVTAGHYTFGGDEYVTVVAYSEESNGEFRATDNFGTSFYAAGTLPAAAEHSGIVYVMGYFEPAERFFWFSRGQIYYFDAQDDLSTNVDWTRILSPYWSGAPPASPTCFAASPTECAVAIDGSPRMIRSADGDTWGTANTGLTSDILFLHWSSSHALWIGLAEDGTLWTAPAGMATWTQRTTPTSFAGATGTPRGVASLGRAVVILAGARAYVSRDFENWADLGRFVSTGGTAWWEWVLPFNGGLWAARRSLKSTGTGLTLEGTLSGVLPSELASLLGW